MRLLQLDLQTHFGGGEVYCAALCRAFARLGVSTRLVVNRSARFWERLDCGAGTERVAVAGEEEACRAAAGFRWLLSHGPLPAALRERQDGRLRTAIVHMPLQGRDPRPYLGHDMLFAVSRWVLEGVVAASLPVWPEPLYGVADPRGGGEAAALCRRSRYDWDRRKLRDRLLGWLEPALEAMRPTLRYARAPGLVLGVVSRIATIKQFPLLFSILSPVIARHEGVRVEIFGAGGYRSVRDLDRALAPIAARVRFWGHQQDVRAAYHAIDYLLAGLPEKEALGLNLIEAQSCGTPVLAPAAPPFTETVVHGVTGFLYEDPRRDGGADFDALLGRLRHAARPEPRTARAHLARFTEEAFCDRLRPVLDWVRERMRA